MQKQLTASLPVTTTATAAAESAAFSVLVALSFSHLLNDMMQSLLPALYPMLKSSLALDFGQVGLITLAFQLTASVLQPVVGIVTDRRPMPYSLAIGMAFDADRAAAALARDELPGGAGGLGRGRARLGDVPPRGVAHGALCLRRPARACAVAVPGRRQCRLGAGAAARRLHRAAGRPAQRRVVRADRAAGHGDPQQCRALVRAPPLDAGQPAARRRRRAREHLAPACRRLAGDPGRADLLEVLLSGQHQHATSPST